MLTTKICFKCDKELPVDDFYTHPRMADGRLGKCKSCTKNDSTARRNSKIEEVRAYDRIRAVSLKGIAVRTKSTRKWRENNPRKWSAHCIINNAIRAGKIKRQTCVKCGVKAHAHHDNYDYPLDVIWLCAVHHSERHKELRKLGIEP